MAFKYLLMKPMRVTDSTPAFIYTPVIIDGSLYGVGTPFMYLYEDQRGTSYRNYTISACVNDASANPQITISGYQQSNSTGQTTAFNGETYFLILANDNDAGFDILASNAVAVETHKISGRYRFYEYITSFPYYGSDTFPVTSFGYTGYLTRFSASNGMKYRALINFTVKGVNYIGMGFSQVKPASGYGGQDTTKIELITETEVKQYTLSQFEDEFSNEIIDFGAIEQELPPLLYNWMMSTAGLVYNNVYTIKSFDGETTLATITDAPPMTNIVLDVAGNLKKITMVGVNGQEYDAQWDSIAPNDYIFAGLNTREMSEIPEIVVGSTNVSFNEGVTLYESYEPYVVLNETFDIHLYKNTAEPNRVDKTDYLTDVLQLHGVLRDECSLISPSIIFESSAYIQFNYVYIPAFGRYYFVLGIDSVSKNLWRMRLNCDVLMSYKEMIWTLDAVIDRQEHVYNPMLNDPNVPAQTNRNVEVIEMDSLDAIGGGTFDVQGTPDFTRRCDYVLLTVGEGASTE